MADTGIVLFDTKAGRKILKEYCNRENIQIYTLEELLSAELEQSGKLRKRGLHDKFDEIIDSELFNKDSD